MTTLGHILDLSADPSLRVAPLHLGKRLLRERTRLGIPIDDVALALQVDRHTITALEAGDAIPPRLSSRLRTYLAKLEAQADAASALAPSPQPLPPVQAADSSALLRSQMIRAVLDRKLNQTEVAHELGVPRTAIRNLIKDPNALIPQGLADTITRWLNNPPTTHHPLPTPEASRPAPAPTHPAILPDVAEALFNVTTPDRGPAVEALSTPSPAPDEPTASDAPSLAPSPQPQTPVDDEPRLDPRLMRLFTNINLHLPRPSSRDVALLALLDKFPDYDAMTSAGEQSQWFRYFESPARLALAAKESD